MKLERPNHSDLTPAEPAHLEKLRALVQAALADGKVSHEEFQTIWELINADHKVTFEELETMNQTIRDALGDAAFEYDFWDSYRASN